MNAIEPVSFEIDGTDIDLPNYEPRLNPRVTDWDEVHDYILHEAASESFGEFSMETIYDRFQEVISEELEGIEDHIPGVMERYEKIPRYTFSGGVRPIYYREDITLVPNTNQNGHFYMLSNNKQRLRSVKSELVDEIQEVAEAYEAMGVKEVNIYHGKEFTLNILQNNENVIDVRVDEFDNEFEENVYTDLEPMSEAFVNNITLSFDSPQEPEYDILFSLGPENTVSIEVEDHSGTDSNPSENDVIDDPSSKAGYINSDCVFTIINGVEDELVGQFRQKSELTDVTILEYDQSPDSIFEYVQDDLLLSALNFSSPQPF